MRLKRKRLLRNASLAFMLFFMMSESFFAFLRVSGQNNSYQLISVGTIDYASPTEPPPSVYPFWSSGSYWHQKIPANARIEPNSHQMINWLQTTHGQVAPYINWDYYTYPVYDADANTPRVTVYYRDKTTPMMHNVPLKSTWTPSPDIEHTFLIIDWSNMRDYECYQIEYDGAKWYGTTSESYIFVWDLTSSGVLPREQWAIGSSSCPFLAMIIRDEEIQAGVINHPLKCGLQYPKRNYYVWPPAARTHGQTTDTYAIPDGARIQLNPALDLDSMSLTQTQKIILKCLQEYGMVVAEESGGWRLYVEGESSVKGGWAQYGLSAGTIYLPQLENQWRVVAYDEFTNNGDVGASYYLAY